VTAQTNENKTVSLDLIDHEKIRANVAFPEPAPTSFEGMIAVLRRERKTGGQSLNDVSYVVRRPARAGLFLVIFLESRKKTRGIHAPPSGLQLLKQIGDVLAVFALSTLGGEHGFPCDAVGNV
jgi:hypothetical protein